MCCSRDACKSWRTVDVKEWTTVTSQNKVAHNCRLEGKWFSTIITINSKKCGVDLHSASWSPLGELLCYNYSYKSFGAVALYQNAIRVLFWTGPIKHIIIHINGWCPSEGWTSDPISSFLQHLLGFPCRSLHLAFVSISIVTTMFQREEIVWRKVSNLSFPPQIALFN